MEKKVCSAQHRRKIVWLLSSSSNCSADSVEDDRWVVNISSKPLTTAQMSVLWKGLNFAPALKRIPVPSIVAAIEQGLRKVKDDRMIKDVVTCHWRFIESQEASSQFVQYRG